MKKKLILAASVAIVAAAAVCTYCAINSRTDRFFHENADALSQSEGLNGYCREDSGDCLYVCSCGATYKAIGVHKGPSHDIFGTCEECGKSY